MSLYTFKNDIALVAPSGTGKSTVNKSLILQAKGQLKNSISATTRAPRGTEKNAKDYFFIPEDSFIEFARTGEFLEYNRYGNTYYGTFRYYVNNIMNCGNNVVYDVDINGAISLRNTNPRVKIFYLNAPLEVIEERLIKRGTESSEKIKERLQIAEKEILRIPEVDFVIDYGQGAIADVAANKIMDLSFKK
ncbi:MAG: guanylate kinase [Patescibacteria group bacterium]